jgi:hypothetical protein
MPGGSIFGSIPIGFLMFLGTVLALVGRKFGRKRAKRDFPSLAAELGLGHVPARHAGGLGVISGTFRGREVRVDPDEQRMIKVRFRGAPRVDLRSYENALRPPFDMVTVYSRDRSFDRFFKTRFAAESIARRIASTEAPGHCLQAFTAGYARQVQSVAVTADGVVCRLDFGNPPYIPPDAMRELLPACVALADLIEPDGGAEASSSAEAEASASAEAEPAAGSEPH